MIVVQADRRRIILDADEEIRLNVADLFSSSFGHVLEDGGLPRYAPALVERRLLQEAEVGGVLPQAGIVALTTGHIPHID